MILLQKTDEQCELPVKVRHQSNFYGGFLVRGYEK